MFSLSLIKIWWRKNERTADCAPVGRVDRIHIKEDEWHHAGSGHAVPTCLLVLFIPIHNTHIHIYTSPSHYSYTGISTHRSMNAQAHFYMLMKALAHTLLHKSVLTDLWVCGGRWRLSACPEWVVPNERHMRLSSFSVITLTCSQYSAILRKAKLTYQRLKLGTVLE